MSTTPGTQNTDTPSKLAEACADIGTQAQIVALTQEEIRDSFDKLEACTNAARTFSIVVASYPSHELETPAYKYSVDSLHGYLGMVEIYRSRTLELHLSLEEKQIAKLEAHKRLVKLLDERRARLP